MGPLKGINILDMGTAGVGPWAATLLAMLDANVIKVEPPFGDALRMQPPYMGDVATAYAFCNIGKRCLVLRCDPGGFISRNRCNLRWWQGQEHAQSQT